EVGQHDDALALINRPDRVRDLAAPFLHIVFGADADALDLLLRSDHMFHGDNELGREPPVRHQYQTDHSFTLAADCLAPADRSVPSRGGAARSRWSSLGENPASRNR